MIKNAIELKRGDVIHALDGFPIPFPIEVTEYVGTIDNGLGNVQTAHIKVKQPSNSIISPDRFLAHKTVQYGRWVTLSGHRLLKKSDDQYVQVETGYEVYRDDTHETWCEGPHPVKLRASDYTEIRRARAKYGSRVYNFVNRDVYDAILDHKKGYHCPGGEIHTYSQWIAWDPTQKVEFDADWCDTPTDAASYLPAKI